MLLIIIESFAGQAIKLACFYGGKTEQKTMKKHNF